MAVTMPSSLGRKIPQCCQQTTTSVNSAPVLWSVVTPALDYLQKHHNWIWSTWIHWKSYWCATYRRCTLHPSPPSKERLGYNSHQNCLRLQLPLLTWQPQPEWLPSCWSTIPEQPVFDSAAIPYFYLWLVNRYWKGISPCWSGRQR